MHDDAYPVHTHGYEAVLRGMDEHLAAIVKAVVCTHFALCARIVRNDFAATALQELCDALVPY